MRKLQVGDYVKITNRGGIFTTYIPWAEFHGLKNYKENKYPTYLNKFRVIASGPHLDGIGIYEKGLIGIQNFEGDFIWDVKDVEYLYSLCRELLKLIGD